ncbi:hypothetical protein F8M41_025344 [Gigaspora margarita]|uniref:Uncharacterized protein n=1 Tax=Gigaspora margarita TaxID=4874 RepID=A0A8H4B5D1_GIGMA|nr:hypothetical protein F8M41_025344 [Gigaspora margarita]
MYNDHRAFKVLSLCKRPKPIGKGLKIRGALEKNITKSSSQNFGRTSNMTNMWWEDHNNQGFQEQLQFWSIIKI